MRGPSGFADSIWDVPPYSRISLRGNIMGRTPAGQLMVEVSDSCLWGRGDTDDFGEFQVQHEAI